VDGYQTHFKAGPRGYRKSKKYASNKKISLSQLIEFYLQSMTSETKEDAFEISPFVKSISSGTSLPSNLDCKEEYSNYLVEKYK
jgi:hypothetical protein